MEVEDRTRELLQSAEMLPMPPMGYPYGTPSTPTPARRSTPKDTPAEVLAGQDIDAVNTQWTTACEASAAHDTAMANEEQALMAFTAARKETQAARKAGHTPGNVRVGKAAAGLNAEKAAVKAARLRRRQCFRTLGWTLLGLQVTARLRTLAVVPALTPVSLPRIHRERSISGFPMGLHFQAPTLLAALWLQFALAITKKVRYRQCLGCGSYLTIHPDGFRSNRRTCSDACRTKASRSRRKKGVTSKRKRPHSAHATST